MLVRIEYWYDGKLSEVKSVDALESTNRMAHKPENMERELVLHAQYAANYPNSRLPVIKTFYSDIHYVPINIKV